MNVIESHLCLQLYDQGLPILAVINGTPSVDTFFTMSGLLMSYTLLKALEKSRGAINIPLLYLHRYLRLTPTYALLVGIAATLFDYAGNGITWNMMEMMSANCRRNWWHNLLYINNLIDYGMDGTDGMVRNRNCAFVLNLLAGL